MRRYLATCLIVGVAWLAFWVTTDIWWHVDQIIAGILVFFLATSLVFGAYPRRRQP